MENDDTPKFINIGPGLYAPYYGRVQDIAQTFCTMAEFNTFYEQNPKPVQLDLPFTAEKHSCIDCEHAFYGGPHDRPECLATGAWDMLPSFSSNGFTAVTTFMPNASGYCNEFKKIQPQQSLTNCTIQPVAPKKLSLIDRLLKWLGA